MADPWSWNTVFETALGTTIGATIGIGGIWWQTRSERKTHEKRLFTEKLFAFNAIAEGSLKGLAKRPVTVADDYSELVVGLRSLSMIAKKQDQKFIEELLGLFEFEGGIQSSASKDLVGFMIGTIVGWRTNLKPESFYLDSIAKRTSKMPTQ